MAFNRVFAPELPTYICWYALTTTLCDLQPSKFYKESPFVVHFPNEFKKVSLENIVSQNGAKGQQASFLFDGGGLRGGNAKKFVHVASPFGVLL